MANIRLVNTEGGVMLLIERTRGQNALVIRKEILWGIEMQVGGNSPGGKGE